jgi:CitMHS family citrate-Mg2+:H+ or citrate-Ca2+:H+ symporter
MGRPAGLDDSCPPSLAAILSQWMSPLVALITIPVASALAGGLGFAIATFMARRPERRPDSSDVHLCHPILLYHDRRGNARPDHRPNPAHGRRQSHAHCSRDRGPDAIGASRRFGAAFLVTVPVMLPLYEHLGMDKRILACAASMAAGVSFLPWTGPMIRASAALHIPSTTIFAPLVLVQLTGLAFVFFELERKISGQHPSDPQSAREDR